MRNGHYAIWGRLHTFTLPTGDSTAMAQRGHVRRLPLTGLICRRAASTSSRPRPWPGLVPTCAMRVQRSTEVGPLTAASESGVDAVRLLLRAGRQQPGDAATALDLQDVHDGRGLPQQQLHVPAVRQPGDGVLRGALTTRLPRARSR